MIYSNPEFCKMVWGIQPDVIANKMEFSNLPPDVLKVRICLRPKCEGYAFVKFADRIERWIIGFDSGKLFLMMLKGVNKTKNL